MRKRDDIEQEAARGKNLEVLNMEIQLDIRELLKKLEKELSDKKK